MWVWFLGTKVTVTYVVQSLGETCIRVQAWELCENEMDMRVCRSRDRSERVVNWLVSV